MIDKNIAYFERIGRIRKILLISWQNGCKATSI